MTNKKSRPTTDDPQQGQDLEQPQESAPTPKMSDPNNDAATLSVVEEWAQESTVHGLDHALDSGKYVRWKRFLWALLVCGAFAVMIWQIESLIREYSNYTVETNTQTKVPDAMDFPEVTVCNSNMYDSFYVEQEGITEPVNEEELSRISQPLEDFILRTWFNEIDVGEESLEDIWKPVVTPYGRCWKFNTDKKVYKPGMNGGLEFYADLEQDYYDENTDLAGLRVFVTQPGTPINFQIPSEFVAPGVETFIGIQKTHFEREREAPWSLCKGQAPDYSQPRCRAECLYAATRDRCGCRALGDSMTTTSPSTLPLCTFSSDSECEANLDDEEVLGGCECSLPPCTEMLFATRSSALDHSQVFLDFYEAEYNTTREEFTHNFVGVRVNFDSIRFERLTESKAMTFAQLLGSIGGSMGLFAGISVLSIVEIFGDLLFLRLLPRFCGYRHLYGLGHKAKNSRISL